MAVTLLFKTQKATIDTLTLDASVSETHAIDIEVTDHPVEQGADVTDHRRRKPLMLTMEGLVTNTPLPKDSDPYEWHPWPSRSNADPVRAESAYAMLRKLADKNELITVVTALATYSNMTLTSLTVPRDASTSQSLRFTAVLREIRIVQNETVVIEASTSRAQPKTNQHTKPTKPTPEALDNRTPAKQITDALGNDKLNAEGKATAVLKALANFQSY